VTAAKPAPASATAPEPAPLAIYGVALVQGALAAASLDLPPEAAGVEAGFRGAWQEQRLVRAWRDLCTQVGSDGARASAKAWTVTRPHVFGVVHDTFHASRPPSARRLCDEVRSRMLCGVALMR
jgi:hypothetical protein